MQLRGIKPNLQTDLFAISDPGRYTGMGVPPDPPPPAKVTVKKKGGLMAKVGLAVAAVAAVAIAGGLAASMMQH
jgi:hypothetical protein